MIKQKDACAYCSGDYDVPWIEEKDTLVYSKDKGHEMDRSNSDDRAIREEANSNNKENGFTEDTQNFNNLILFYFNRFL